MRQYERILVAPMLKLCNDFIYFSCMTILWMFKIIFLSTLANFSEIIIWTLHKVVTFLLLSTLIFLYRNDSDAQLFVSLNLLLDSNSLSFSDWT